MAYRLLLTLTVKLSPSFANEVGAQRVAPWPPARWCEENTNAQVVAFSHSLTVHEPIAEHAACLVLVMCGAQQSPFSTVALPPLATGGT